MENSVCLSCIVFHKYFSVTGRKFIDFHVEKDGDAQENSNKSEENEERKNNECVLSAIIISSQLADSIGGRRASMNLDYRFSQTGERVKRRRSLPSERSND